MNKIKEIRNNKNLSLRDLGKLSNVSFAYLWQLETGKAKNPREGTKILIAKALHTPVEKLFFND